MKKKWWLVITGIIILLGIGVFIYLNYNQESFSVKTYFLRLNIPLNGTSSNTIKITNNENSQQEINLKIIGLDANYSIANKVNLNPHESKDIDLKISDNKGNQRVAVGKLIISSNKLTKEVPITIVFEKSYNEFIVLQESIPKYDNVYPGGTLGLEIKIFDMDEKTLKNLETSYYIKNFEDELIFAEEGDSIAIEGRYSFSKLFSIPENIEKGKYVLIIDVEQGEQTFGTHIFEIQDKKTQTTYGTSTLIIAGLIILIGFISVIFYSVKTRDDLLLELKKQQNKELEKSQETYKALEEKIKKQKKNEKEKQRQLNQLKQSHKKIKQSIEKKHKKQKQKVKSMKKKGTKKDLIKKQINSWQNQGYKIPVSNKDLGEQIQDFQKQGYKI